MLRANDALTERALLAAEVFRDADYQHGRRGGNHWLSQRFGFEQGFDAYQRFTRDYVLEEDGPRIGGLRALGGSRHHRVGRRVPAQRRWVEIGREILKELEQLGYVIE